MKFNNVGLLGLFFLTLIQITFDTKTVTNNVETVNHLGVKKTIKKSLTKAAEFSIDNLVDGAELIKDNKLWGTIIFLGFNYFDPNIFNKASFKNTLLKNSLLTYLTFSIAALLKKHIENGSISRLDEELEKIEMQIYVKKIKLYGQNYVPAFDEITLIQEIRKFLSSTKWWLSGTESILNHPILASGSFLIMDRIAVDLFGQRKVKNRIIVDTIFTLFASKLASAASSYIEKPKYVINS